MVEVRAATPGHSYTTNLLGQPADREPSINQRVPSDAATPDDGSEWRRAGVLLIERLDRHAWPQGNPWDRPVRVGEIDYWRVHAHALDQLGTVLEVFLPGGELTDSACYVAAKPQGAGRIEVSLLSGSWWDAAAGRRGRDLVSLVAHVAGLSMPRAATKLARRVGVEARRHV